MVAQAKIAVTMKKTVYSRLTPYVTKDGSTVRELIHPASQGNTAQSLAEALVPAGKTTQLHRHHRSEEIYHVMAGEGLMTLGSEEFTLKCGDSVCIPPGMPHCIRNIGREELRIICACAPPYAHDDTELLG